MLLEGKSVVVTGGNSGIGKAIVPAAAAAGANVVVDYRMHPEYTAEVVAAAGRAGGRAVGVEADVSRTEDLHRVIQTAVENFGRLDVLVGWCRLTGLTPTHAVHHGAARRPQPAHPARLERPAARKHPPRRRRAPPENPAPPTQVEVPRDLPSTDHPTRGM